MSIRGIRRPKSASKRSMKLMRCFRTLRNERSTINSGPNGNSMSGPGGVLRTLTGDNGNLRLGPAGQAIEQSAQKSLKRYLVAPGLAVSLISLKPCLGGSE